MTGRRADATNPRQLGTNPRALRGLTDAEVGRRAVAAGLAAGRKIEEKRRHGTTTQRYRQLTADLERARRNGWPTADIIADLDAETNRWLGIAERHRSLRSRPSAPARPDEPHIDRRPFYGPPRPTIRSTRKTHAKQTPKP